MEIWKKMEMKKWKTVTCLDMESQQPLARYFVLVSNFKLYVVSKSYEIKQTALLPHSN